MLKHRQIFIYGASIGGDEVYGTFTANFAKKRAKYKVKVNALIGKKVPEHMLERDVKRFTEIRTTPHLENHPVAYFIYGDEMLILTVKAPLIAIHIKSATIIESQKRLFEILWKTAKKFSLP